MPKAQVGVSNKRGRHGKLHRPRKTLTVAGGARAISLFDFAMAEQAAVGDQIKWAFGDDDGGPKIVVRNFTIGNPGSALGKTSQTGESQ